jgi:protein-S-isoprenylcysteine O-methyltransferase Ste14
MDLDLARLIAPHYSTVAFAMIGIAGVVFVALLVIDAPYGRHMKPGWGPTLSAQAGWILMELPAPIAMALAYVQGAHRSEALPLFFLALFQLHYLNRAVVQPLLSRGGGRRTTLFTVTLAFVFNSVNGTLVGLAVSQVGVFERAWLTDPRFIGGIVLFVGGAAMNLHADSVLRSLRAPGESGYRIPHGGLYEWVSCPNYLGEILEWVGFAIATWSLAGLAFAVFTFANLAPRARANHRWYHDKFEDYPEERRALLPLIY